MQEALDRQGRGNRLNTFLRVGVATATTRSFLGQMSIGSLLLRVTQANSKRGYASVWMNRSLEGEKITINSNEFEGSVNSRQFTVQQGHTPTSIMDPYNN